MEASAELAVGDAGPALEDSVDLRAQETRVVARSEAARDPRRIRILAVFILILRFGMDSF